MQEPAAISLKFLEGGGEMGAMIREYDWKNSAFGSVEKWPHSLRTTVGILLHSAFPMFLFWGEDNTCFYNDAFRPSLGNDGKHPALGKRGSEVWQEMWQMILPLIQKVLRTGAAVYYEDLLVPFHRNGKMEDIYWTFSYSPAYGDNGDIAGVLVTCKETTDRVIAAQNLRTNINSLHHIILQAPVAMCIFRGEQYVVEIANTRMLELWGRTSDDVMRKPIFESRPEIRGHGLEALLERVYTTGLPFSANGFAVTLPRDGALKKVYVNFVYEPYREADGTISGVMAVANEVTEQVLASQALEKSEQEFRILANTLPELVWTTDPQGAQTFASKRWKEFTGLDPYDQNTFAAVLHPDDVAHIAAVWGSSLVTGGLYQAEARLQKKDGEYQWFSVVGEPVRDQSGQIQRWVGAFTNINEQKKARQRLLDALQAVEESERRFRNVANSAPALIWMAAQDQQRNFFNKEWLDFTGEEASAHEGEGWRNAVHPDDLARCLETYAASFEKKSPFQIDYRLRKGNGGFRWISEQGVPRFKPDGFFEGYIAACMDIHDNRLSQIRIKENEERLSIVIDASELGTWEWDMITDVIIYSERYLQIFGHEADAKLSHLVFVKQLYPDDVHIRDAAMDRARLAGSLHYQMRIVWPDGSIHWIEVKGKVFYADSIPVRLIGTLGDITQERSNQLNLKESEQRFRLLTEHLEEQVIQRTGQLSQKNRELEKMNAELESFAYVSSHDLQEPLRKIQTFASLISAKEVANLSDKGLDYFRRMQSAAGRMQSLIEDLLAYSRLGASEEDFRETDVNDLIAEVTNDLRETIEEKHASIETEGSCILRLIRFQFRQLLANLLGNALKFSKPDVPARIVISINSIHGDQIDADLEPESRNYCHISIADNGIGFDPQYRARIFEVFQRLHGKEEYKGTGIGLSIVKKIVDNHHGIIRAEGKPGLGATFHIFLPSS